MNKILSLKTFEEEVKINIGKFDCKTEEISFNTELGIYPKEEDKHDTTILHPDSNIIIINTKTYKYIGETNESFEMHGFGICKYIKGDVYVGQFLHGKRHGIGKLTLKNDDVYQGEFRNDTIDGFMEKLSNNTSKQGFAKAYIFKGEIVYMNANYIVEATIVNESVTGHIINPDKNYIYEGQMQKSYQEGYGISYTRDKYVYKGEHSKGKFHGYGELYNPFGKRFFGTFNNNERKGFGLSYLNDSRIEFGRFIDDLKNGPFLVSFKNSIKVEMFNYGFKYKIIEKVDLAKNYCKVFYPEFDWLFKVNFKAITDIFNEVQTIEFNVAMTNQSVDQHIIRTSPITNEKQNDVSIPLKLDITSKRIINSKNLKKISIQKDIDDIYEDRLN